MYIDKSGNHWYKGNLHTHTKRSDGKLSPDETKAFYRSKGYDFLALTDHWKFGENSENDPDGLLVLSGAEYNFNGEDVLAGVFHIVGVGALTDPEADFDRSSSAQDAVNAIIAHKGAAIFAHPAWSLNTWDMLEKFENITAVEIYNSVSGAPRNCRPYSGDIVDQLAARGKIFNLAANDDTHFYLGEEALSYNMVNLGDKPLNRENIVAALLNGNFYATQGPKFSTRVENGEFIVECEAEDNIERVTFFTNRPWENNRAVIRGDSPITTARFPIERRDTFVRAEIYSSDGKVGWSQIQRLK